MRTYIIRRLVLVIPTVFIATIFVFIMIRILPGDIVDRIMSEDPGGEMVDKRQMLEQMGLDASLPVQYGRWLGVTPDKDDNFSGIFQGNLGISWWREIPVIELIALTWPITFELSFLAIATSLLWALPIGIYSAIRQDTWGDYGGRSAAILAMSVPAFWIGTMVIVFPAIWWNYMPPIFYIRLLDDPLGNLKMMIVPAIIMGLAMSGLAMRMSRTMMLEVLRQDYIRTAWSKGLRERVVVTRHALKNALIPLITIIGIQMPVLLGGAVIIERIFNIPGMGRLLISAIENRDYPLISGILLVLAGSLILVNLIVDLTYAYLDPRIQYK
jgi:peptide/nickel transport system permease protein